MQRRVSTTQFCSLDGLAQPPGGPLAPSWDEVLARWPADAEGRPAALLLGRRTFEGLTVQGGVHAPPVLVASRRQVPVGRPGAELLPGDAGVAVTSLKQQRGPDLHVAGSVDLLRTLFARDLVDVVTVWTLGVVTGTGERFVTPGSRPGRWCAREATVTSTGAAVTTWERDRR